MDFSYFQIADAQEAKIEADDKLQYLDEEIRDNYLVILNRFYIVFESIHKYIKELNTFVEELNAGMFIQQSMEKVFQDGEGKQLLVNIFLSKTTCFQKKKKSSQLYLYAF